MRRSEGGQTVVLIDDDDDLRNALRQGLELESLRVEAHGEAASALARLGPDFDGAVISDIRMPRMDGMELLRTLAGIDQELPVILITGHGDVPLAVEAMRAGAYDFLEKPFSPSRLAETARRALEKRRLVLENRALRDSLAAKDKAEALVGSSAAMSRLRAQVRAIAATAADVLVTGETGSGKEVVSRAIHDLSARAKGPFVAINCAALPGSIIESELFGHERGAFTGAQERRIGKLEHAQGGTVLLDEIESMPLDLQAKLLRAIETKTIERLGSNRLIPVDVRFIAASKEDLAKAGQAGRFRPDLYYRLAVASIRIPPLREHREDIAEIFLHLARQAQLRHGRAAEVPPAQMLAELSAAAWPGNIRELRNAAERYVLGLGESRAEIADAPAGASLSSQVEAFERQAIAAALKRHDGRIRPVYEELGISRKTLYDKMKRHGL
jgi:two-component system C4-dicarboxylate transport response regulator DctD